MHYRLIPTSFDPTSQDIQALQFPFDWWWVSVEDALRRCGTRVLLARLPLFWQALSPLHTACTEAGCTIYVNEQGNMPAGEAAARVGEANTVITDAKDAFAFYLYLAEKNTRIPNWIVVHKPGGDLELPPGLMDKDLTAVQEVHLFPGIPMLVQCESLAKQKLPRFHQTAVETLFNPPVTYTLEPALIPYGMCECGKEIVGRPHNSHA